MDTHLTRFQWNAITGRKPQFPKWAPKKEIDTWESCPTCPMTYISWNEVQDAISELASHGVKARFLTEAEAEYIARLAVIEGKRVVTETPFPWGSSLNGFQDLWFNETSGGEAHRVKTTPPSSSSRSEELTDRLYDTHGNVFTWTADEYTPFLEGPISNPRKALTTRYNSVRVVRGGSWGSISRGLRSAFRSVWRSEDRSHLIGVRLVIVSN